MERSPSRLTPSPRVWGDEVVGDEVGGDEVGGTWPLAAAAPRLGGLLGPFPMAAMRVYISDLKADKN